MKTWLDGVYSAHLKCRKSVRLASTNFEVVDSLPLDETVDVAPIVDDTWVSEESCQPKPFWSDFPQEIYDYDAKWTYVVDLDRNVFTINSMVHFRLDSIPLDWISHLVYDEQDRIIEFRDPLDTKHIGNVVVDYPDVDSELVAIYSECTVAITETSRALPLKAAILLEFQSRLRYDSPRELLDEWTIYDVQMQKLVYAFVKCCCWEAIKFGEPQRDDVAQSIFSRNLLVDVDFPRQPDYYISAGNRRVLMSLATDLDVDDLQDIRKMSIGKVIKLTRDQTTAVACVISLTHVIIVDIDRTNGIKVTHTEPLPLFGETSEGRKALIATLSPHQSRIDLVSEFPLNLPVEVIEQIFKFLVLIPRGEIQTIPCFARTCKLFAAIVHDRVVHLPGRTFLTYPTEKPGWVYGIDDGGYGWKALYNLYGLDCEYNTRTSEVHDYPYPEILCHRKKRFWVATIDGANFGVGRLCLGPMLEIF